MEKQETCEENTGDRWKIEEIRGERMTEIGLRD